MTEPQKVLYAAGLLAKNESTYGGGGTLSTATDGVQLALDGGRALPLAYEEVFDGVRAYDLAARSPLPILAPGARFLNGVELPTQWKGAGSAYSASVVPNLHALMKASGLEAAVTTTPGAEKWTYTPWAGGTPASLVAALYGHEEKWTATHGFTAWSFRLRANEAPRDLFKLWGLISAIADDANGAEAITITYPNLSLEPPTNTSITVTIGSFTTPEVREVEFELGWEDPTPRQNITGSKGFAGWARGVHFAPRLRITLEATALVGGSGTSSSGVDHHLLRSAATKLTGGTVKVQRGSSQYNRLSVTFNQAQLMAPPRLGNEGSIATVTLEFGAYASTPVANDAVTIVAD